MLTQVYQLAISYLVGVSIHWTGLLDWITGLKLFKNGYLTAYKVVCFNFLFFAEKSNHVKFFPASSSLFSHTIAVLI